MGQRHTAFTPSYGSFETDARMQDDNEEDRLLQVEDEGYEEGEPLHNDTRSSSTADSEVQEGVRKIEAISRTWTQRSLIIAYLG